MALLLSGVAFDAHEVSLREKPEALLALSPKGTVPVLKLPEGEVLDQSWDIMRRALTPLSSPDWWGPAQTPENLEWMDRNDGAFKHHLDRYKYPARFADTDPDSQREQALQAFLLPLDRRLAGSRFLGGELACATDIAVFPFVRQFAAVDPAWFALQPIPALRSWLTEWLSSPLFLHCMHRLPDRMTVRFPPFAAHAGSA
jgi:glutathione S-transferase